MSTAIRLKRVAGPRWEPAWFCTTALMFVLAELAVMRAWATLTRPFWLDETSTYLLATRQSLGESMQSLAAGADFNPPSVYLLYRAVATVAGGLSPTTARIVALLAVVGALTTVYVLLRDQFTPWPAAIGTLGVWAQQVVMHAAFDARFYGPLLLASGCFFLTLVQSSRQPSTRLSALTMGLTSIAVCTAHYFGIFTWTIAVATSVLSSSQRERTTIVRRMLPAIAGPVALALCYPLYVGQRAATTVPTWMPQLTPIGAVRLLSIFFLTLPVAVALVCWGLTQGSRWWRTRDVPRYSKPSLSLGPRLLATQAAIPFVMVVFSFLVQPATELRYWVVGAFAAAPVIALVMVRASVPIRWIGTVGIMSASVKTLWGEANRADAFVQRVRHDVIIASRLAKTGQLVVTRHRDTLYPILHERPDLAERLAVLDSSPLDTSNAFFIIERDVGRVHCRIYGFPPTLSPADLDSIPSFYFVEQTLSEEPRAAEFPGRVITRVDERAYSVERRVSP